MGQMGQSRQVPFTIRNGSWQKRQEEELAQVEHWAIELEQGTHWL
jgi:hypothetical protein